VDVCDHATAEIRRS